MDISEVRAYALSSPIDPPQQRQFHGGVRQLHKRDVVLVTVVTKDGTRGVAPAGASSSAMREYFEGESQGTFADVVEGDVAEALEGVAVGEPAEARAILEETTLPAHLRREAISAIDVALWDLSGKEAGAPIYELLAERYHTKPTTEQPLYASAGMYMEPRGYVEQAKKIGELGFFGYKYRPGIGPKGDERTIELLADGLDDMEFMLDVHTWWKLREPYGDNVVRDLVESAANHGAYWIEEPVEPDDYDGYVGLAETGAPLAGGESEGSASGLVDLAQTGAVEYLQGDVRHHEGFTGCMSAIDYCEGRQVEFVPHNFGTWLGLIANAHLVASAPGVELLEYPVFEDDPVLNADPDPGMYPFNLAFDILEGEPMVSEGRLTVPDGPGLGITINDDVIDGYPFIEGPWTEFHYNDE